MKFKALLFSAAIFLCSACLSSEQREQDETMWRLAYEGDENLVQKLYLTRECSYMSEDLTGMFALAYLYYRLDRPEDKGIFRGIDSYMKYVILLEK